MRGEYDFSQSRKNPYRRNLKKRQWKDVRTSLNLTPEDEAVISIEKARIATASEAKDTLHIEPMQQQQGLVDKEKT